MSFSLAEYFAAITIFAGDVLETYFDEFCCFFNVVRYFDMEVIVRCLKCGLFNVYVDLCARAVAATTPAEPSWPLSSSCVNSKIPYAKQVIAQRCPLFSAKA